VTTDSEAWEPEPFDDLVDLYDELAELTGGPVTDYLSARLPAEPGGRAADLGCGTGRHATLLAEQFDEVLAVDVSAAMIAHARRHRPAPNIRYQHRDLREVIEDWDGWFDLVVSVFTLHHQPDPDRALKHIRRLIAPGGQALLIDLCDQPRSAGWLRRQARRTLAADLRQRRQPVGRACRQYRLSTHPAWLAHQTGDRPLPPGRFEQAYTAVFPGADITLLDRARAVHWHHPHPPRRERAPPPAGPANPGGRPAY
jgi:SAM-dependent methyltransferase